ncbi:unnamed protein product, partial [Mesorhabditis spiculigera]
MPVLATCRSKFRWRFVLPVHAESRPDLDERQNPVAGLDYCPIPKNGSSNMKRTMCRLYYAYHGTKPPRGFKDLNRCDITENWLTLVGKRPTWKANTVKIVVLRDPLRRFASAYEYLCKERKRCGRSGKTIHTFARMAYKLLAKGKSKLPKNPDTMHLRRHVAPQSWFCQGPQRLEIMLDDSNPNHLAKEMSDVFERTNVPERVSRKLLANLRRGKRQGKLSSNDDLTQEVLSNTKTLSLFLYMYYNDYKTFQLTPSTQLQKAVENRLGKKVLVNLRSKNF